MQELQKTQKQLEEKAHDLSWTRDVKTWPWDDLLDAPVDELQAINVVKQLKRSSDDQRPKFKVTTWSDAPRRLQNQYLQSLHDVSLHKIDMLQRSLSSNVMFVHVYEGQDISLELMNTFFAQWATVVFVVEKNTRLALLDTHVVPSQQFGAYSCVFFLAEHAHVEHIVRMADGASYHSSAVFYLQDHAQVKIVALGEYAGEYAYHTYACHHVRKHSTADIVLGAQFTGRSKSLIRLINNHLGQHTGGDIVFKGIGRDTAKAKIDGWIMIGAAGEDTHSYLQEDVLLASEKASIVAEPNLEIITNDVKASHGATLGTVDEQQLLYLQSRGLTKQAAEDLILRSFLRPITEYITNNQWREKITQDYFG